MIISDNFNITDNPEDQLNSLYDGVAVRDISNSGIIDLKGADVLDFLNRISTNNVKNLAKEQVRDTIFTTEKGRIIDLSTLLHFGDYYLLVSAPANKKKLLLWLNKYIIADDVKAVDTKQKYALLEVSGSQADSFMYLLCGRIAGDVQTDTFKVADCEGALFFLIKRLTKTGKTKYWLLADPENARKILKFMDANKGPYHFNLIGDTAYTSYRVEKGLPAAPEELNDEYNPHEALLTSLIDTKKGCYIGQEVIARLETYDKVQKYLTGVTFAAPVPENLQYPLVDSEGKEAGKITTAVYSFKCKKHLGLAYIRKAYLAEGTRLYAVHDDGTKTEVTVTNLPFKK